MGSGALSCPLRGALTTSDESLWCGSHCRPDLGSRNNQTKSYESLTWRSTAATSTSKVSAAASVNLLSNMILPIRTRCMCRYERSRSFLGCQRDYFLPYIRSRSHHSTRMLCLSSRFQRDRHHASMLIFASLSMTMTRVRRMMW